MNRVGVLGAGSWGTALAVHLATHGDAVVLWARREVLAEELERERENRVYLPDVRLPAGIDITSELGDLEDCELVLVVVPSHGFRDVVRAYLAVATPSRALTLVSGTKGIEIETLARMSQVTAEESERSGHRVDFAILSGPTFAAELARDVPSAAVVAAESAVLATRLRERLATPALRLYSSGDVVGVELGGAAKNVVAVGAGVLHGLGLGDNTLAALITRGLHEMKRLCLASGGDERTLSGLAGLGDLVLTCTGGLSRNRRAGIELARGKSLEEFEAETSMVAEGMRNSLALSRLAEILAIELPIVEQMRAIIYDGKSAREALEDLMAREQKAEAQL